MQDKVETAGPTVGWVRKGGEGDGCDCGQIYMVYGHRTLCVDTSAAGMGAEELLERAELWLGIPRQCLGLRGDGASGLVGCGAWVSCVLRDGGLKGGKGGFGAALRASGKRNGGKTTTDFGACRDLNGRRLRHVNNEMRLKAWRDEKRAQENDKEWDQNKSKLVNTESGIKNWFLGIPTWAEDVNKSKKDAREPWKKHRICKDWERARGDGRKIPDKAPPWYGCPRGRTCPFAHGMKELSPEGKRDFELEKHQEKLQREGDTIRKYLDQIKENEESVSSSVSEGIRRSKLEHVATTSTIPMDHVESHVRCLCGDIGAGETGEIQGASPFATAGIPTVAFTDGKWYYEVECISDVLEGALQIGWATQDFEPNEETNDGCGDKSRSWAFDPIRRKFFKEGTDMETTLPCIKKGDIVGCEIDLDGGKAYFAINGTYEQEGMDVRKGDHQDFFFPCLSIESDLLVRVNLGQRPFQFEPWSLGAQGVCGDGELSLRKRTKRKLEKETAQASELDLNKFGNAKELEALGADTLKQELQLRGLKCGGNLQDRAERLFSVKGLTPDQYDPSLKPKQSKKSKR